MTKVDENIKTAQNMLNWIVERCYELERENQKLKEERDELKEWYENLIRANKKASEHIDELEEENKKLKYVIDSVMEKEWIEYIRLADWDVFMNPKNKLHISDTIQVDILNGKQ